MALPNFIQRWLAEPPPDRVFEISESCLAAAPPRDPAESRIEVLNEPALEPSPSSINFLRPQAFREVLSRIAPVNGKRNAAALVIPDYAVRMAILDFEDFPASDEDRIALIRFRLRKSVPFHIDEAKVSYSIQLEELKRVEVFAVAIARPILDEYETLFTEAGYRVGLITPSCVAALPLYGSQKGLTLVAKMAGTALSILLIDHGRIRLVRSLDLAFGEGETTEYREENLMMLLQQTMAFAEDQIGQKVDQLLLCGFGQQTDMVGQAAQKELSLPYQAVRSRFGTAAQANCGLLGLLEKYAA